MRRIRHTLLATAAAAVLLVTTACEEDLVPPPDPSPGEDIIEPGSADVDGENGEETR